MNTIQFDQNEQIDQLYLKINIDNVQFFEPQQYLITIFLKSYGMKLKTNVSDCVSQPTFVPNTFYIPLRGNSVQIDDLLTFEVYVVDENVHTLLGRAVIQPNQYLYSIKGSNKYLLITTIQKRKEVIVGQLLLTLYYSRDTEGNSLNQEQSEKNYLNQLLARSFLEGVENPLYEKQYLKKIIYEKNIDLLDPTNYKEKWKIYSQTLKERQQTINQYKQIYEQHERILRAQQVIKTDYIKGNRLLRQLYSFNKNRLWGEEHVDFSIYIDQKIRMMNEKEIFAQMSRILHKVIYWQKLNADIESFLLNSKALIENFGQLLLMKENSKEGYKDSVYVRKIIENEVSKQDYYKQKIVRQYNFIDKLSKTMENVLLQYQNNEHLEREFIDMRGDVLTVQQSIRKKLYGEQPQQIEELQYLQDLCRKLDRICKQQQNQIIFMNKQQTKNNMASEYQKLQIELRGVQSKVNALEEQIKLNGEKFSQNIAKLKIEIEVKKNAISTASISNISYKLPSDVNQQI
ncbi:hypothetical protein ABPG74_004260 [Tetrahymena malaccensis]